MGHETSKALFIDRYGDNDVLVVRERPSGAPAAGQVRINVKVAGLNFAEVTARQGLYPDAPKPPCVVGYEGAGVVDMVGTGVSTLREGQRVLFLMRFGSHAEHALVPAELVIPIPDAMSFETAAAIPVNYLTALQMIQNVARVRSGDRVLIHMAAGGVGTAVLQMLRHIPDVVTFGTSSKSKHGYLREQGCTHPIDRHGDYVAQIRERTGGTGVDIIMDPLGGADWTKGYALLREGGILVCFGMANVAQPGKRNWFRAIRVVLQIPKFNPMKLMGDNRSVGGVNLGHLWHRADLVGSGLQQLVDMWTAGKIAPHIDSTWSFAEAGKAFSRIELGKNVGKVLLTP